MGAAIVRCYFVADASANALLASRFERRSILLGSLWWCESSSEHRGAPRVRASLEVTKNEHESPPRPPSNHSLQEQTTALPGDRVVAH
jgi:hypothetical protein